MDYLVKKNSIRRGFYQRGYNSTLNLKRMIFPPISEDKLNQLMIDNDSIKFITFANSAQEITNIIMNNLVDFPCPEFRKGSMELTESKEFEETWVNKSLDKKMKSLVITEMTAGVGGNVLNFAKYFKYVNAIEIDRERYLYLNRNIKLYDFENVNCYNEDSGKLLIDSDHLVQDIVFFDPPWGGPDYKLHDNLRLTFCAYSIENVCKILFQRPRNKMIVMKLPNNYDFEYFNEELKDYAISKFNLDRMTIVVVKNYNKLLSDKFE